MPPRVFGVGWQAVEKLLGAAAPALRDEMREASRVEWRAHFRKASDKADRPESCAPSGFARKMPICVVALLGFVVRATTYVARLAFERFSCQTRLPESSSTAC
jgi:hypothetical protein